MADSEPPQPDAGAERVAKADLALQSGVAADDIDGFVSLGLIDGPDAAATYDAGHITRLRLIRALQESGLKFWMSDADDAIAGAEETAEQGAAELDAREEVGDADPLLAIQDALATFPADRIVVIGDPDVAEQAREKFDVPVESA